MEHRRPPAGSPPPDQTLPGLKCGCRWSIELPHTQIYPIGGETHVGGSGGGVLIVGVCMCVWPNQPSNATERGSNTQERGSERVQVQRRRWRQHQQLRIPRRGQGRPSFIRGRTTETCIMCCLLVS